MTRSVLWFMAIFVYGDVLNTTSGTEETSRQFAARILASSALPYQIPGLDEFDPQSIRSITLKGKQQKSCSR